MVRSGSRPGQVLSSGKHTGPGKLGNGKKGIQLRKVSRISVDSGCPPHSDSESQSEALHSLDSCAALLRGILRKEDSGAETASSENRNNPRRLEGKRYGSKRKGHEKCTVPLAVRKENETQATPQACSGLSASTPDWLPQQPSCPQMVHTEVQTDDDNSFPSQAKTFSGNSTDLRNSFSSSPRVPGRMPKMEKPAIPVFTNGILPQEELATEPDLLKCFQTYINLLCSHGKESQPDNQLPGSPGLSQPTFLAANEEKSAREKTGEITSEGKDFTVHMQDTRMKELQKAKNVNQYAEEMRTVKYLVGELKALGVEHGR